MEPKFGNNHYLKQKRKYNERTVLYKLNLIFSTMSLASDKLTPIYNLDFI